MKIVFLVLILCGLTAARSYHAPLEVACSKGDLKQSIPLNHLVDGILQKFLEQLQKIVTTGGKVQEEFLEKVESIITEALDKVDELSDKTLNLARDLVTKTQGKIQELLQKLLNRFDRYTSPRVKKNIIENVLTTVLKLVQEVLAKTGQISEELLKVVENTVSQVLEHVTHLSEGVLKLVRELVSNTHGKLQEILQKILDKFDNKAYQSKQASIFQDLGDLKSFLGELLGQIKAGVQISVDKVQELVQKILDTIANIGNELADNPILKMIYGTGIQELLAQIRDKVSNLTGTTAEAVKDLVNKVITAVQNLLGRSGAPVIHFHSVQHFDIGDEVRQRLTEITLIMSDQIRDSGFISDGLVDLLTTSLKCAQKMRVNIGDTLKMKLMSLIKDLPDRLHDLIMSVLNL